MQDTNDAEDIATYEQPNSKSKKSAATKITSWSILADVVRKLDRAEPEAALAPANGGDVTEPDGPAF